MEVHERMKMRRKELGLTVDEVAEAVGVSRSTYYRYESGDIEKVPTTIIPKLCKILKSPPDFIMGWSEDEVLQNAIHNLLNTDDKELIDMLYDISVMTSDELGKLKTAYKIIKKQY